MKPELNFIHAADLHLDSPFKGLAYVPEHIFNEIQQSTFRALDRIVETAIEKKVDFILLVGDLFDNDKQSLKAQIRLKTAFEKLYEHQINVYMSYGNHDHQSGNLHPITYPNNVFIFPTEEVTSFDYSKGNDILATIYGFSYENRAVMKNKAVEYKEKNNAATYHIGTLHGSLHGNQAHDPYAPFSLSELQRNHFDYWALGHIHKREVLSENPPIIYPGNTQGRHRNEQGEKGCYHVSLSGNKQELSFIPTQEIIFEKLTVNVEAVENVDELLQVMEEALGDVSYKRLVDLSLESDVPTALLQQTNLIEEVIEVMNEKSTERTDWTFIYTKKIKYLAQKTMDYSDFFLGELADTVETLSIGDAVSDLFNHSKARRYLEQPADADIREQAKAELMELISNSRKG